MLEHIFQEALGQTFGTDPKSKYVRCHGMKIITAVSSKKIVTKAANIITHNL